jgi:tetratricopeptide (TPR) repeat protein
MDSMGWVYYKQGRGEEAVDLIQKAIYGMETDDAVLRDHLGDAYLLKGDVTRARKEWQRALRLDPDMPGLQQKLDQHKP